MPATTIFLTPEDRWAIIAYVRALQRAAHGKLERRARRSRGRL